jgi:hypothetical protein
MPLFALRLRDGNCLVIAADTESEALNRAHTFSRSAIASCRPIQDFIAEFTLSDDGDLKCVLQEGATVREFYDHEYPMLAAAVNQSYADFDSSVTDSRTDAIRFDDEARAHRSNWGQRDREIVTFAVLQERQRFSN